MKLEIIRNYNNEGKEVLKIPANELIKAVENEDANTLNEFLSITSAFASASCIDFLSTTADIVLLVKKSSKKSSIVFDISEEFITYTIITGKKKEIIRAKNKMDELY